MFHAYAMNLMFLITAPVASASDGPSDAPRSAIRSRCDALFEEFTDLQTKYVKGVHAAKTDEEARISSPPDHRGFAARFMAMAREHPDDPAAVDALTRALLVDFGGRFWKEATEQIQARHVRSPRIGQALRSIAMDTTPPDVEPLLRTVLLDNPDAQVRSQAALALAEHLQRLAGESEHMRKNPAGFERAASQFGREFATRLRDRDPEAMRRDSESIYETVIREFARVEDSGGSNPAEEAAAALYRLRELVVGRSAPEIEGKDVDGRSMKLSDYRGKVVALVFWATWCGPCMAAVPHERELVRRMEGRPFALIGVNGDEGMARLKHQIEEMAIPWRSFVDGGPDGPISTRWNVKGWPTVFVLDPEGVIRYAGNLKGKELDDAVETLLPAGG